MVTLDGHDVVRRTASIEAFGESAALLKNLIATETHCRSTLQVDSCGIEVPNECPPELRFGSDPASAILSCVSANPAGANALRTPRFVAFLPLLLAVAIAATSCDSSDPDPVDNEIPVILKSAKRGLAFNLTNPSDFNALKEGVSWWYNWYWKTDAPSNYLDNYQMEFIPMLWGRNAPEDFTRVKSFILAHPEIEYLLVMNEPNLTDQANRLPAVAASDWLAYENLVAEIEATGRELALVGPAITWGTQTNYWDPVVWLDAFYAAYRGANAGRDPRIDYLAFHWYDYGLDSQLDRLVKYGKRIWVTEMANWNPAINSYEKQAEQMRLMVALCESRDDVFRYAWFIGRGDYPDNRFTYLLDAEAGVTTSLGELYLSLPYSVAR